MSCLGFAICTLRLGKDYKKNNDVGEPETSITATRTNEQTCNGIEGFLKKNSLYPNPCKYMT